ncbi:GspH family T2SS minor pseudopilin variant ExeH [Aeromonas bivalvium]|uniref:Type II secretion system protein H n=1 Tax=Aeromonas bivalvium TaxID=440079 RepID=A0ABW9GRZ2_9GAMM|nr:GspH family T2SS minor pseudopilin variant ExeH [Aeromonas bivalvium]
MKHSRQAGFTLLEVLLVAMLMGLVATAVTLSMGGARGDRELDKQARRFMAVLQQAQQQAVMDGRLLGLRLDDHGWQFMRRQGKDRSWQPLEGDKLLGPVELGEDIRLTLELAGFAWLPRDDERGEANKTSRPQVLIFPGDELTPFVLTLSQRVDDASHVRVVRADEFGALTLSGEATQ